MTFGRLLRFAATALTGAVAGCAGKAFDVTAAAPLSTTDRVAVLEVSKGEGHLAVNSDTLSDYLTAQLRRLKNVQIVPQSHILEVAKQKGLDIEQFQKDPRKFREFLTTEANCNHLAIHKINNWKSPDKDVAGERRIGSTFMIVDIGTNSVVTAVSADFRTSSDGTDAALQQYARELVEALSAAMKAPAADAPK